ncbi:glutaredoxin family protein [Evansella sp. AB-P1]|uniref:glutaredoxin family protein n=1 Tax=Evansella sp. AB-P1 TaxID=3037653 RepID=UPI00241F0C18|nr:glutaredoxin family protein [Evansella sp. AB-P1]MDG5786597.1 glutaredoxin family protein [Evansella sp. AB-P1]
MRTLYFYTKTGCPLCDKGLATLKSLNGSKETFHIVERDIYKSDEWLEKYQIRIPVVEDDNGTVLDEGILSREVLLDKMKYLSK